MASVAVPSTSVRAAGRGDSCLAGLRVIQMVVGFGAERTVTTSKASAGSGRAAHGSRCSPFALEALSTVAPRYCSLRASLTAFVVVLASPSFPEPASPLQSTRWIDVPPAVPGGLKGRAAVGPSRTTQAPQRSEERSESRSGRAPRGLSRCCDSLQRDSVRISRTIHTLYLSLCSPRTTRCAIYSMTLSP